MSIARRYPIAAFKAQAMMRELTQRLQLQMPTATITTAYDANGFPAIWVGYSSEVILVKILMDPNAGTSGTPGYRLNGLGLAQQEFSPHITEILQDSDQTATAAAALKARTAQATGKLGTKILINANTLSSLPTDATTFDTAFAAATPVVSIPSDEINPLTQSQ